MALTGADAIRILKEVVRGIETDAADTAEERALRAQTVREVTAIIKAGGMVEIPPEWVE
jgi:hypothetical protein